jgi:hypothetical protein
MRTMISMVPDFHADFLNADIEQAGNGVPPAAKAAVRRVC